MSQVIDFNYFSQLLAIIPELDRKITSLESEVKFLKELHTNKKWLDRKQAMEATGLCDPTLRSLSIDHDSPKQYKKIRRKWVGKKPFFLIDDIRDILKTKKFLSEAESNHAIIMAVRK